VIVPVPLNRTGDERARRRRMGDHLSFDLNTIPVGNRFAVNRFQFVRNG
jgi:hypothetical protein